MTTNSRTRALLVWFVVLSLAVAACGSPGRRNAGDGPGGSGESKDVDALAAELVDDEEPGIAILVIKDGTIEHAAGDGLADLGEGTEITPQTIFHLASCGKQMTALAIMMLAEEGELGYDDPVSDHLSELASIDDGVTIRRLLHHTSALPDVYEQLGEEFEMPTNEDLLATLAEIEELEGMPGEAESYSNVGYDVLGSVIERVSGQRYEEFMRDRIFEPLEMTSTFSLPSADGLADPRRATGYTKSDDGFEILDSDPLDGLRGSGSIYSSIEDMYAYDRALDGDALLDAQTLAEAFEPGELNDGTAIEYGFGWELGEYDGRRYAAHSGAWIGFVSYYLRYPEDRLSVIILSNRHDLDAEALPTDVGDLFLT